MNPQTDAKKSDSREERAVPPATVQEHAGCRHHRIPGQKPSPNPAYTAYTAASLADPAVAYCKYRHCCAAINVSAATSTHIARLYRWLPRRNKDNAAATLNRKARENGQKIMGTAYPQSLYPGNPHCVSRAYLAKAPSGVFTSTVATLTYPRFRRLDSRQMLP